MFSFFKKYRGKPTVTQEDVEETLERKSLTDFEGELVWYNSDESYAYRYGEKNVQLVRKVKTHLSRKTHGYTGKSYLTEEEYIKACNYLEKEYHKHLKARDKKARADLVKKYGKIIGATE